MNDLQISLLLIEDSPDDAFFIQEMLAEASVSFPVTHCDRLAAGLEHLSKGEVDAVLLDLGLPDSRGLDTFSHVRAAAPHIPIVVLSGLDDEALALKAVGAGAQDYLVKGQVDSNLLVRAIRYAMERRRIERALRQSQEQFKSIFDNVTLGIYRTTPDGRILMANPALLEILGYESFDELADRNLEESGFDPDHPRTAFKERIQRDGQVVGLESAWQRKDGSTLFVRESCRAVRDDSGGIIYYEGTVEDVTGQMEAEEALRRSERNFRHFVEQSRDAIVIANVDGSVTEWNRGAEQIFGLKRADVLGRSLWDVQFQAVPKEDRTKASYEGIKKTVLRLLQRDEASWANQLREVVIQKPDGSRRVIQTLAFPIETKEALMLGSISRDVTASRRAEEEREKLLAQIREQTRQMRQIMNTVPEGVFLIDLSGKILLTNSMADEHLATLSGARVGDTLSHLSERPLSGFLTSPPKGLWHEVSAGNRRFEVIARPIENGARPEGWVLVTHDVTEEHEVQRQLQQQERLAAVGQLAAGIAHDFNNIMAIIVLYTQMALRNTELACVTRERLETVGQQAKSATDLIQQILDFSRRALMERRPMDLAPFLKEMVKLLERTLPESIQVDLTYGTKVFTVNADPTRMQQVIMNLAVNARDAMPKGGRLQIALSHLAVRDRKKAPLPDMETGEWIRITVSDTGTGIPPEALNHVFEPFFTTKAPGKGSGLGLAQVYGIVKQHEGHIDVETEVGQGTTFVIYLPSLVTEQPAPSIAEPVDLMQGRGETILLVEDDEKTRRALGDCLEMLNYRVLMAANGQEAIEVFLERSNDIALVLTDVVMPKMGGIALFHTLKQKDAAVKVILLTGHSMEKELEDLRGKGLTGWMAKPPDLKRLAYEISRALLHRGENS